MLNLRVIHTKMMANSAINGRRLFRMRWLIHKFINKIFLKRSASFITGIRWRRGNFGRPEMKREKKKGDKSFHT
jgi:hypothetical protein